MHQALQPFLALLGPAVTTWRLSQWGTSWQLSHQNLWCPLHRLKSHLLRSGPSIRTRVVNWNFLALLQNRQVQCLSSYKLAILFEFLFEPKYSMVFKLLKLVVWSMIYTQHPPVFMISPSVCIDVCADSGTWQPRDWDRGRCSGVHWGGTGLCYQGSAAKKESLDQGETKTKHKKQERQGQEMQKERGQRRQG